MTQSKKIKMKKKPIKSNVCSVLSPIHSIARALGVLPYSIKIKNKQKTPVTSKTDFIYTLVYFSIYLAITIRTIYTLNEGNDNFEMVSKYTVLIESSLMIFLMFTFVILECIFRVIITKSLNRLRVIDETLESIKIDLEYVKAQKWVYSQVAYIITSVIIRLIFMLYIMNISFTQQLLMCVSTIVKSVAKNLFVMLVVQVYDRFEKINATIRAMFEFKSPFLQHKTNDTIKNITKVLYVLCRTHYKLRKIIQNIITAYSIQLLVYLGVALANIIFQSYFLYTLLTSDKNRTAFFYMASTVSWLFDEIYELYTLVRTCSTTSNIAADTATILHQLRNHIKNIELESHVQMYSLQMLHQQIEFSALGFVTVDYSLLYSIIGAVTTYLVILIQFDQAQLSVSRSQVDIDNSTMSSSGI